MGELSGRLVIVTGATGNVGKAVCGRLLEADARVWAMDRNADSLRGLVTVADGKLGASVTTLTSEASIEQSLTRAGEQFGAPWGLVHTVGAFRGGSVTESATENFEAMIDTNLRTTFFVARAVMKRLLASGGGRIVTVGSHSAASQQGLSGAAAYNASKAAVLSLTKAMDEEGRSRNVRAMSVAPATIDTPPNRAAMPDADFAKWVTVDEMADAILSCLSPSATFGGSVLQLPNR